MPAAGEVQAEVAAAVDELPGPLIAQLAGRGREQEELEVFLRSPATLVSRGRSARPAGTP